MSANLQAFMEHRWGHRRPLDLAARFSAPTLGGWGRVRNVSLSGAYIETAARLAVAQHLFIEIKWQRDGKTEWSLLSAWVVRRDDRGLGVEWTEFAPWPVPALFTEEPGAKDLRTEAPELRDFRLVG